MSRKTICLNMIVKNESKIIRETLVNICKYDKIRLLGYFRYWF